MKTRFIISMLLLLGFLAICLPAAADPVLYDNGGFRGLWALPIGYGSWVTNTIDLPSNSLVTGFSFAFWVGAGDVPASVGWSVFDPVHDLSWWGTFNLTSTKICADCVSWWWDADPTIPGLDAYTSTVTGLNILLPPGELAFSLYSGQSATGGGLSWDVSAGPSRVTDPWYGDYYGSEAFTIYGTPAPEPGTLLLLGNGLIGLAVVIRMRRL